MKKILFLLFISQLSFAQQKTNQTKPILTAGDELIKAQSHFYTGAIIGALGFGLLSMPTLTTDETIGKPAIICGSLLSLIGTIITFESFSHIGKAGVKLNESKSITFNTTKYGATVALHF